MENKIKDSGFVKAGHDEALEFITKLHVELFSLSNTKKHFYWEFYILKFNMVVSKKDSRFI